MRRIRILVLVAAVSALIAGCADAVGGDAIAAQSAPSEPIASLPSPGPETSGSAGTPTDDAVTSSAESPSAGSSGSSVSSTPALSTSVAKKWRLPNPVEGRKRNPYGDVIAKPGQANGVSFTTEGKPAGQLVFVVTKITVDPKCVAGAPKSHRGHFLRIDLAVEPRDITEAGADLWNGSFGRQSWIAFDAKGTAQPGTDTEQAEDCADYDHSLPVVDSRALAKGSYVTGAVVLDVSSPKGTVVLDLNVDGGWEYQYG